MVNPAPARKDPLNIEELIRQATVVKKKLTPKQITAKQGKSLKHGEELLARGKILLAKGRDILKGDQIK